MDTVTTSVIVPVYNDPEGLETTVDSLLDQTVEDYEIIIADNGSTDGTQPLAIEYATRDRITHVIEDEIQSSYAARNAGIETATGEILCFIDADMWVESTWLEHVQSRINQQDIDYLGCDVEVVAETDTYFAKYSETNHLLIEECINENNYAPTCSLVVRRDVIEDVGMFDDRLISGGDAEFGRRVNQAGYDQRYADDITLYHPARESLSSILKKKYRISRGKVQRVRYHPDLFQIDRHPLHPRNYLPIKPRAVNNPDGTLQGYLMQYLIMYMQKLVISVGHLREWYFPEKIQNNI